MSVVVCQETDGASAFVTVLPDSGFKGHLPIADVSVGNAVSRDADRPAGYIHVFGIRLGHRLDLTYQYFS